MVGVEYDNGNNEIDGRGSTGRHLVVVAMISKRRGWHKFKALAGAACSQHPELWERADEGESGMGLRECAWLWVKFESTL